MSKSRLLVYVVVISAVVMLVAAPAVAFAAPQASTNNSSTATTASWGGCWHRVIWGETLNRIAWHHGTTAGYLRWLNGLHNANYIIAGRWLRVPCYYHRY